ncbi:MAG: FRG domain-containing protein [candidate division Zixibacteria bacterium]|nr:FRG domain-containing protein [candidate division Zixibacteria bacterium]
MESITSTSQLGGRHLDTEPKYSKYREIRISTLDELLSHVECYSDLEFFRGQSKSEWDLRPKLSRLYDDLPVPDSWDRIEWNILQDFKRYATPHYRREPRGDFQWMVLGQHYGLPTRLLDWTSNPLKAAFFAVNESIGEEDGALYALEPTTIDTDADDYESLDKFDVLTPILPKMIDERVVAQEACFTAFPLPPERQQFKPLEDGIAFYGDYWLLLKIIIPGDRKLEILKGLNRLGASSRVLFPDLSGLCEFLKWHHRYAEFG